MHCTSFRSLGVTHPKAFMLVGQGALLDSEQRQLYQKEPFYRMNTEWSRINCFLNHTRFNPHEVWKSYKSRAINHGTVALRLYHKTNKNPKRLKSQLLRKT